MNGAAVDIYTSPATAQSANVTLVPSLEELLPPADFLTIHTPLIASTKGMISSHELNQIKPGLRVLNVARGGVFDELALLAALESGHIAEAGIDVFTMEPPFKDPESSEALLIAHSKCIATPHLGASTVEAQTQVGFDVCEQVLQILVGELPRSAINTSLILPAEYKTLQPYVRLVEKMGGLYTQHYTSPRQPDPRSTFELIYQGDIAVIHYGTGHINIVNTALVANERSIIRNEQKSGDAGTHTYSALVPLIARPLSWPASLSHGNSGSAFSNPAEATGEASQHIVSGCCSDNSQHISRTDRFAMSFVPEGNLLICHNYDSPGKIEVVSSILGRSSVNVNCMSVARASYSSGATEAEPTGGSIASTERKKSNEALMILGVDREVGKGVVKDLVSAEGVVNVKSVIP